MTIYAYRCAVHGEFTSLSNMGEAPTEVQCPQCDLMGARVYGSRFIQPNGASGDGYFRDSRTGATSRDKSAGKRNDRWV